MNTARIWFNNWFSTAYNIIDLIKLNEYGEKFEVFVSNSNSRSVNFLNADHAFVEPKLCEAEYIDYCLDFCKKNKIDIFLPYYRSSLIAGELGRFKELRVKVLLPEDTELLVLLNDKALFYRDIINKDIIRVPEYYIVKTKDEFSSAYNRLKQKGRVCFKPVSGVGGVGFRMLKEKKDTLCDILNMPISNAVCFDDMVEILSREDNIDTFMIMEYLDGDEYSIDCLADKEGRLLIAIPRKKVDKYNRFLENNHELINIAMQISQEYKIPYVYNIQVKYKHNVPNLLEINTRMSGGIHYSCFAGINIPYYAIKILQDKEVNFSNKEVKLDIMIGNVDKPVISAAI